MCGSSNSTAAKPGLKAALRCESMAGISDELSALQSAVAAEQARLEAVTTEAESLKVANAALTQRCQALVRL